MLHDYEEGGEETWIPQSPQVLVWKLAMQGKKKK